ncbi:MAG: N-hydroxyarylamine O-acetyltransferase [Acidimicrobiaceae bacterium]|nr:N-hydroxyarylamine O-acetyltransferase [Acidimicrobiaceae bacterium]
MAKGEHFDLDAYLERIGYRGGRTADLATLQAIVVGHCRHIAFENLDPFLHRTVGLDMASLQAKLVGGGRGGYCFEQNLLLIHALATLGYRTTGLAARVLWNRPSDGPPPPRSHMLVRVQLDDGPHLVDVGFGGLTLTGVLRLEPDVEQETPHEPFRLQPIGDEFVMQAKVGGRWQSLYRFGLGEAFLSDYSVTSWYLCNHPESPFATGLMAARVDEARRYALRGHELAIHHLGGASEHRELASPIELMRTLETDFGLNLDALGDLEVSLRRLW